MMKVGNQQLQDMMTPGLAEELAKMDPREIQIAMDEALEESYEGLTDPQTGLPITKDVAKKRVARAEAREKQIRIDEAKAKRKQLAHRRATKQMVKRAKKSARRKNKK